MLSAKTINDLLVPCIEAATEAGAIIEAALRSDKVIRTKPDGSPVTDTDEKAEGIIYDRIAHLLPEAVFVGEERVEKHGIANMDFSGPFWLVDALDGTREFVRGFPDVTVNIALIDEDKRPVLGVLHAPAHDVLYWAIRGGGTFMRGPRDLPTRQVRMRPANPQALTVLGGKRSSIPETLEPYLGPHVVTANFQRSSSLKFGLVAEGRADVYTRLGDTYEWDLAAGDIILNEAGGRLIAMTTGTDMTYGKTGSKLINPGFVAASRSLFKGLLIRH